jgi:hypothetical protein
MTARPKTELGFFSLVHVLIGLGPTIRAGTQPEAVLGENKDFVPGCFVQPHGYVVFATTIFGDAFCFDTNTATSKATAPVVLIAHDLNWDEMKREDIVKLARPTVVSFEGFLGAYVSETLDIQPNYPGDDS